MKRTRLSALLLVPLFASARAEAAPPRAPQVVAPEVRLPAEKAAVPGALVRIPAGANGTRAAGVYAVHVNDEATVIYPDGKGGTKLERVHVSSLRLDGEAPAHAPTPAEKLAVPGKLVRIPAGASGATRSAGVTEVNVHGEVTVIYPDETGHTRTERIPVSSLRPFEEEAPKPSLASRIRNALASGKRALSLRTAPRAAAQAPAPEARPEAGETAMLRHWDSRTPVVVEGDRASGGGLTWAKEASQGNQDGLAMSAKGAHPFVAVADEAGGGGRIGNRAGVASAIVLQELSAETGRLPSQGASAEEVASRLENALQRAHTQIKASGANAYTTVSAGVRVGNKLVVAQVGDSTLAVVRNGKVVYTSKEDNKGRELWAKVKRSDATGQLLALNEANVVTQAIGVKMPSHNVEIIDIQPGDRVVVFSDGVGDGHLEHARSLAEAGKAQPRWNGDVMLDEVVRAMQVKPGGSELKSPRASSEAVRDLIESYTQKGWAKPDDVSFGVLDLR